jgi:nicotinic acid mononucleotide adenylyltransferase/nicotinamide mononucleotide (NMN) deamidase PncC
MNEPPPELIEAIHMAGCPFVLAVTGGGSRSASSLLEVPGASSSVLEVVVPYARSALEHWLGGSVDAACSQRTACAMAMVAFYRARQFGESNVHSLRGIAATASLATKRSKKGGHRLHVAWQSSARTVVQTCEWVKDRRTRAEEEQLCVELILHTVATACGVSAPALTLPADETVKLRNKTAPQEWTELVLGARDTVLHNGKNGAFPKLLFPGAFHPLHEGHRRMAAFAADRLGLPVCYELSMTNVDKPPLDFLELDNRLQQFQDEPILLTRASTFAGKAVLVPGATFIVGADTIARMGQQRYYASALEQVAAINTLTEHGCRFLVFGRKSDQQFLTLEQLALPSALRVLCDQVLESDFRADMSSTQLRAPRDN